jgi:hypothetical protein
MLFDVAKAKLFYFDENGLKKVQYAQKQDKASVN